MCINAALCTDHKIPSTPRENTLSNDFAAGLLLADPPTRKTASIDPRATTR